jgi:hypothetical protein
LKIHQATLDRLNDRVTTLRHRLDHKRTTEANIDRSRFDWFADSCPCQLPPGECREHPRARASQRPPEVPWNKHLFLAGRGSGKSRAGAEWIRDLAQKTPGSRLGIVGATASDVRDTMILGPSGIMSISPDWFRPVYHSSLRRLDWPNGSQCLLYSAEEPSRLRGPNFSGAWIDEIAAWDRATETMDMLSFALRIGDNPQLFMTSTPRATKFIRGLVGDPKVTVSKASTYENRAHLAPSFFTEIISRYEGSRLGEQELNAAIISTSDAAVFPNFTEQRNVTDAAEYNYGRPCFLSVDAGVSRYTGACFFQSYQRDEYRVVVKVFGDYLSVDKTSLENAEALKQLSLHLPCQGHITKVLLDPAASARSGNGPAARGEYERVFPGIVDSWPLHRVHDGIDQVEILIGSPTREPDLLIHSRAAHLIDALKNYRRAEKRGEVLDSILDPQHTEEDLADALRGAVRFLMPDGHAPKPQLRTVHRSQIYG